MILKVLIIDYVYIGLCNTILRKRSPE